MSDIRFSADLFVGNLPPLMNHRTGQPRRLLSCRALLWTTTHMDGYTAYADNTSSSNVCICDDSMAASLFHGTPGAQARDTQETQEIAQHASVVQHPE